MKTSFVAAIFLMSFYSYAKCELKGRYSIAGDNLVKKYVSEEYLTLGECRQQGLLMFENGLQDSYIFRDLTRRTAVEKKYVLQYKKVIIKYSQDGISSREVLKRDEPQQKVISSNSVNF
jgi:hypothetical protein